MNLIRIVACAALAAAGFGLLSASAVEGELDLETLNRQADSIHSNGKTALMLAARDRELERVRQLLAAGADVQRTNDNGGTPLMYAALGGDSRIVRLFVDRDSDLDARAKNGWSAIMIAAAKGYIDVIRLLLDAGANPNLADVYRWTPLMRATFENRLQVAQVLLDSSRTDVNQRGENGITALHLAVTKGHAQIADLLLRHGADRTLRDYSGRTPLAMAQTAGDRTLVELLRP